MMPGSSPTSWKEPPESVSRRSTERRRTLHTRPCSESSGQATVTATRLKWSRQRSIRTSRTVESIPATATRSSGSTTANSRRPWNQSRRLLRWTWNYRVPPPPGFTRGCRVLRNAHRSCPWNAQHPSRPWPEHPAGILPPPAFRAAVIMPTRSPSPVCRLAPNWSSPIS